MKRKTRRAIAASFLWGIFTSGPMLPVLWKAFRPGAAGFVEGPSGPMLLFQVAVIGTKSIGPEGPPTK
ncbi:DUF6053 domain-containing protein, partial [Lysobacter sp. 2RAB21]